MFDCAEVTASTTGPFMDPRLQSRYLRCLPGTSSLGAILLVGVVHDHPASSFRVDAILETIEPDVLALELPPLALPLFRMYSRDVYTPPRLGGEMSLVLQTAGPVRAVGIDAPNRTYLHRLGLRCLDRDTPNDLLPAVVKDLLSTSVHAVACRLGALLGSVSRLLPRLYSHIEYDCTLLDPPGVQAEHEADHIDKQQAFLRAVEIPRWRRLIDETRDDSMAADLHELRSGGDVIAIVGIEHLDPLEERLDRLA